MKSLGSSADAARILGGFFREQSARLAQSNALQIFSGSGFVVAYELTDPSLRIVLDGSVAPTAQEAFGTYINDPQAPLPDVTFSMSSEQFDGIYSGELQLLSLVTSGRAVITGNRAAGMRLLPAVIRLIPFYKRYREVHS
ncbi:MAG: SCP2 sterol-binding domain-containing protein [Vulcanimicrobiaceae bacterium]